MLDTLCINMYIYHVYKLQCYISYIYVYIYTHTYTIYLVRCKRRNMLRFKFCLILLYFQLLLGFVKVIWIMSCADGDNKLMYTVMFLCCVNIVKCLLGLVGVQPVKSFSEWSKVEGFKSLTPLGESEKKPCGGRSSIFQKTASSREYGPCVYRFEI